MRVVPSLLLAASLLVPAASCGHDGGTDPNDPDDPNALGLAVAVRVDTATFQRTGDIVLELIPSTATGRILIDEPWSISTSVTAPRRVTPALLSQQVQAPDARPFRVALDVDNSGSMLTGDPTRQRARAAEAFWTTLFAEQADAEVSLFHFGLGELAPSPTFVATRILQGWTADPATLAGKLDTLTPRSQSPLYTSALEVVRWIDSTTAPEGARRVLVLITDARTNRELGGTPDALVAAARAARVQIYTVGLGAAADRGASTEPSAVSRLQVLSSGTGGLYAGAATPERLSATLRSFASSSAKGVLLAYLELSPVPPRGTRVQGTVALSHPQLGVARATWAFDAP